MPEALLATGLAERLGAVVAEPVRPGEHEPSRDPETGFRNAHALVRYTRALAAPVADAIDRGLFPVVLGGDCTILLGCLLAVRQRGRHRLLFVDGHADFYQPEANVNGEAASSELALATGRGSDALTTFEGPGPLVRDVDVVVVGHRDAVEAERFGSQPLPASVRAFDLPSLREVGAARVAAAARDQLEAPGCLGHWIHFDVDVLDDDIMPAVDYRQPDGLSWSEASEVLTEAIASPRARGLDVTIFNPTLDPDGRLAVELAELLLRVLGHRENGSRSG